MSKVIKQLTNNRFLNIKEIEDLENNVKGYQFAERLGVNSVAFIGYSPSDKEFLVNKEYKPPVSKFITGAFGGSIDKDKTPEQITIDEVKEEAGFVVTEEDVKNVGKVFVSTQMNQFCYLYLVYVDKKDQQEREPENAIEAMAQTEWVSWPDLLTQDEWKAMTIFVRAIDRGLIPLHISGQ